MPVTQPDRRPVRPLCLVGNLDERDEQQLRLMDRGYRGDLLLVHQLSSYAAWLIVLRSLEHQAELDLALAAAHSELAPLEREVES